MNKRLTLGIVVAFLALCAIIGAGTMLSKAFNPSKSSEPASFSGGSDNEEVPKNEESPVTLDEALSASPTEADKAAIVKRLESLYDDLYGQNDEMAQASVKKATQFKGDSGRVSEVMSELNDFEDKQLEKVQELNYVDEASKNRHVQLAGKQPFISPLTSMGFTSLSNFGIFKVESIKVLSLEEAKANEEIRINDRSGSLGGVLDEYKDTFDRSLVIAHSFGFEKFAVAVTSYNNWEVTPAAWEEGQPPSEPLTIVERSNEDMPWRSLQLVGLKDGQWYLILLFNR